MIATPARAKPVHGADRDDHPSRYRRVRAASEMIVEPLEPEDCVVQSMPDVSPTRWHLAHTTWFFETFVLERAMSDYRPRRPEYRVLFNSYYNTVGEQFPRLERGVLSRPTVREILEYRKQVDEQMETLFERGLPADVVPIVELGLHHEEQHQELMLTDIKHVFSCNPLHPVYHPGRPSNTRGDAPAPALSWRAYGEGVHSIGHEGGGFHFDNEGPRHRVFLEPFDLANRLVTNGEYLQFIADGGYERADLWLSLGWREVSERKWRAPLYWQEHDGGWQIFTLAGLRPVVRAEPVCHVSYFEADAFARWAGARLPSEAEWEVAAATAPIDGNFAESGALHTVPVRDVVAVTPEQLFGDVWEWTQSSYAPYPGYAPLAGALGEYNGKFMCNQYVLRGGSCVTPVHHIRATYRNFFPPEARWQFSGIRLAR